MTRLVVHGKDGSSGSFGRLMFEDESRGGATHFDLGIRPRLLVKIAGRQVQIAYFQSWRNPEGGPPVDTWIQHQMTLAGFRQTIRLHTFVRRAWELHKFHIASRPLWNFQMTPPAGAITIPPGGGIPQEIQAWWNPPPQPE